MRSFSWSDGYRPKVSAEVAGRILEPLLEQSGKFIVAKSVVNLARNPKSPLHPAFEWDDSVAAEEYRTEQARKMLHSLRIKVENVTNTSEPVRFFVNIKPTAVDENKPSRLYTSVDNAMSDSELRRQVLVNALRELESFRRKYAQFQELAKVHEEIDKVLVTQETNNPVKKRLRDLLISA